ncbi:TPA: hypothetical protein ACN5P4_005191 [Klebsiella pneumoniae]
MVQETWESADEWFY